MLVVKIFLKTAGLEPDLRKTQTLRTFRYVHFMNIAMMWTL